MCNILALCICIYICIMYRFFIFVCIYNLYFIFVYIFDSVIYSYMYICFLYVHMSLISLIKFIVVYE